VRRSSRRLNSNVDAQSLEIPVSGGQEEKLRLSELKSHFSHLPDGQQQALLLVGVDGYSYDEAAKIANCAVGTMKSRVCRARMELGQNLLEERPRTAQSRTTQH